MKKTLLLSVVASTMIMAGGDITPVEPVVEAPVVASGWDFSGQAVAYYQTRDNAENDLFASEASAAAAGLQLGAVNKDLFAGIGAGFELSGISDIGLFDDTVGGLVQNAGNGMYADDNTSSVRSAAAITQAYLTYGMGNTSVKVGRQQLPKALSPFAFSEGWNVFKNTFDAALLVNSDIADTTLVYAYVVRSNGSTGDLNNFTEVGGNGVATANAHMVTAQNKSIDGLTLTGSFYYVPEVANGDAAMIPWLDAKFKVSDYSIALQGGTAMGDAVEDVETVAYGAKVGANFGMFNTSVAFSSVDDGAIPIHNLGTNIKTPLYTQMILNQGVIKSDTDYIAARAGAKALGGNIGVAFGYALEARNTGDNSPFELDVTYKTKVTDSTTLWAGYVMTDSDDDADARNFVRIWGRYNF